MLQKGSRRTSQRINSGPFSLKKPTKKSAQVHFNRISSQFKKKLKHGSTGDIFDSVKSELGWLGLCVLFLCVISVCYIIIIVIYSGNEENPQNLHAMHNRMHPDHMSNQHDINAHLSADGNAMDHGLNIDPEHWPHHIGESREDPSQRDRQRNRERDIDRNIDRKRERDKAFEEDKMKMEEYLERKQQGIDRERDRDRQRGRDREREREDIIGRRGRGRERERERDREDIIGKRRERDRERARRRDRGRDRNIDIEQEIDRKRKRRDRRGEDIDDRIDIDEMDRMNQQKLEAKIPNEEQQGLDKDEIVKREARVDEIEGNVENVVNEENEDDQMLFESNWDRIWNAIQDVNIVDHSIEKQSSDILSEKAYRIKSGFLHAWHGYAKHALGHDEIQPVSDLPGDSWGGLGATLIDALDTMMLMGIKDEFKTARDKLQEVNFKINLQASFFETTIRHLGGLIGAYEMSNLLKPKDDFILQQAISLADQLLPAFNTESGIPKSMVNLENGEIKNYGWTKDRSVLSEVGSNQLEFYAMSEYTNDGKYYEKSSKVFTLLNEANQENVMDNNGELGLYSRLIETDTATFPKNEKVYSLGGMSDSFYEYQLKLWILTNYNDKLAIKMYVESINAANEKLLREIYDKNRREEPYYFYGELWYTKWRGKMEELQCFMPGVLALGSYHAMLRQQEAATNDLKPLTKYEQQLIDDTDKHLKLAHVLLESCVSLYREMPTGLAPESIEFSENGGWNPKEMKYQLRPETVESLYILHSLTGNEQYRIWAWDIFQSIEKHCKTDVAYSGIQDVTEIPAKQDNQMQSYVMAETFKYLYLLFDEYAARLLPLNQYVFNTEAHPIRIINNIQDFPWYKPDIYSNPDIEVDIDNGNDQYVEDVYNENEY